MNEKKQIAPTKEIDIRKTLTEEFCNAILDPYEHPWLITDEASLYDLTLDEDEELIKRINEHYGLVITSTFLSMPFWKLLDYLKKNRTK